VIYGVYNRHCVFVEDENKYRLVTSKDNVYFAISEDENVFFSLPSNIQTEFGDLSKGFFTLADE
jgi:hypothetical protein